MARELKIHLLRSETRVALCGKVTENNTEDPETVTCKSCSGMYRTNMEWYSQVRNKAVESRGQSGEGDLYTRSDLEAGLHRLGWSYPAIRQLLNNTLIFRDVVIPGDSGTDPWSMDRTMDLRRMGVRGNE